METTWKTLLWQQFGAAIDMLENAIVACPDELWNDRSQRPEYWYVVFHALFWLDFYPSKSEVEFQPPAPFTLDELDPAGLIPERPYTKEELHRYLEYGRKKCRAAIEALTDAQTSEHCVFDRPDVTAGELFLYNMRHVQHHAGQLNLILRQKTDSAPRWVSKARNG